MAKTNGKSQTCDEKINKSYKFLSFESQTRGTSDSRPDATQQQAQNFTKGSKIPNHEEMDFVDHEGDIAEDYAGNNRSLILDQGSADEENVVETEKIRKVFPFQLQQWAFETSNINISLAERLEKSKWKYEKEENSIGKVEEPNFSLA